MKKLFFVKLGTYKSLNLIFNFFSFFSERSPSNPNYLSASRTNENVIFGNGTNPEFVSSTPRRKKSSSSADVQSPIDSTTQL